MNLTPGNGLSRSEKMNFSSFVLGVPHSSSSISQIPTITPLEANLYNHLVNCVRGTRTQPLICLGCSVHYWVPCAINKGFFEIAFVVVVDTHLPRFEALAYVLPHFDALTHVVILVSSAFIFQRFAEV